MRGATKCASRLKQLLRSLRTKLGKVARLPTSDPITQMILGIFSRDVTESKARESLDRLRDMVVDYNELRVIPSIEVTEMVGDLPQARIKCEDLSRALNKLFAMEHEVSLDRLSGASRKEVQEYLAKIDGLDAYSRARVQLLGLRKHAIPLDEAMWAYARKQAIVDARCSLEEAQSFLERRIPDEDAMEVVALLEKQAWAEMGAAVRKGEADRIASVPPDRTTRNMLQMVAGGYSLAAAVEDAPENTEVDEKPPEDAAKTGPSKAGRTADKASKTASTQKASSPKRKKTEAKKQTSRKKVSAKKKPKTKTKSASLSKAKSAKKKKSKPARVRKSAPKKTAAKKKTKRAQKTAAKTKRKSS